MYLTEVRDILSADVLSGADALDQEVRSACGSDFMSDVLAYVKDQALLLMYIACGLLYSNGLAGE